MSLFTKQGYLTIRLDTGIDLVALSATNFKIKYKKPDGTNGSFDAQIDGTTGIKYTLTNEDVQILGKWMFQAWVTIGGLNAFGEIVQTEFKETL